MDIVEPIEFGTLRHSRFWGCCGLGWTGGRLVGGAAVAWPLAARGQQRERMRRIGVEPRGLHLSAVRHPQTILWRQGTRQRLLNLPQKSRRAFQGQGRVLRRVAWRECCRDRPIGGPFVFKRRLLPIAYQSTGSAISRGAQRLRHLNVPQRLALKPRRASEVVADCLPHSRLALQSRGRPRR
jgi:hypothetical protein